MRRLSCQEVLDQLWEYLDEEARSELSVEIETHLRACSHCQVEVDSIRRTVLIYRADEPVVTPLHLSEQLQAALEDVYRERGEDEL